jgi:hypothetical protein
MRKLYRERKQGTGMPSQYAAKDIFGIAKAEVMVKGPTI